MGGEQAASVLASIRRNRAGEEGVSWPEEEEAEFKAQICEQYDTQGQPYYSSARLWDDGVIDPLDTRAVLARGLAAAENAPAEKSTFGIFRM